MCIVRDVDFTGFFRMCRIYRMGIVRDVDFTGFS